MPNYTSKTGTVDDAIVQLGVNINNTLTGFTSEDFLVYEDIMTTTQKVKFSYDAIRVGTDLVIKTVNNLTDKVTATTTVKGGFSADGLDFFGLAIYRDGQFDMDDGPIAVGILKNYSTSSEVAENERIELNWDAMSAFGTNSSETIYAATNAHNLIWDGEGNDRVFGGYSNEFNVGAGNDTLTGGSGEDNYVFDRLSSFASKGILTFTKTITNFDANGGDEIEMDEIAFNHKMKFTDARTSANWKRGDIIFERNGNDGWLLGNTDRDKDPEIKIVLVGVTSFDANSSLDLSL